MNDANGESNDVAQPQEAPPLNVYYRLTVVAAVALIVTILALAALSAGDPAAPANRWLSRYGGLLVTCEVVLCLLFGLVALASDRRRIEQERQRGGDGSQ